MPTPALLATAGGTIALLVGSVLLARRTLERRSRLSAWEEVKQWIGVAIFFGSVEAMIYMLTAAGLRGLLPDGTIPLWGWTILTQGIVFGVAAAGVAWTKALSPGKWFGLGLLGGPLGLIGAVAADEGEEPDKEEPAAIRDSAETDSQEGAIPIYTSQGKVAELTGASKVLFLLFVVGIAGVSLWIYTYLARAGHDLYVWPAFIGAAVGCASLLGLVDTLFVRVGGGCRERFFLIIGVFLVLALAPPWAHVLSEPSVTSEEGTAYVSKELGPVAVEANFLFRATGPDALERTSGALGRAVYRAASGETRPPEQIVVDLWIPCPFRSEHQSGFGLLRDRTPGDYTARDTIRDVGAVRAHASAAAYATSDHWTAISEAHFAPEAPCGGTTMGHADGLLRLALAPLQVVWWAMVIGGWPVIALLLLLAVWFAWRKWRTSGQSKSG